MSGFTTATAISAIGLGLSAASDFGLFGNKAPSAAAPPKLPPAAAPPSLANVAVSQAVSGERARVAGAVGEGFDNTISTTPLGTTGKTETAQSGLLGAS